VEQPCPVEHIVHCPEEYIVEEIIEIFFRPMALAQRQVAYAALKWLNKQNGEEDLRPLTRFLTERFSIRIDDPDCRDLCDVGLDLESAVQSIMAKSGDSAAIQEKRLKQFIAVLKSKGYFQGVKEGTPAYFERYETAKRKFEERNNPYDGLTADQLKTHGNQKMANGYYQEAVTCYTKAIEMDDTSAIYYANRASAYTHLKQYSKAIVDCETALKLDAMYSKAYSRLGTALFYEGSYERAVENYARALELDPTNAAYEADLRAAQEKVREVELSATATTGFDFSSMANMLNNPEFLAMAQNVMQQPQFADMIAKVSGNLGLELQGDAMPDFSAMFANLAAQQPADGSIPDVINTPFGNIKREQLENLQQLPEIQGNPKFHRIMEDVRLSGPMAMMKHMNDPEVLGTMTKLASSLFASATHEDATPALA